MAKAEIRAQQAACEVGTIGHVDHGKDDPDGGAHEGFVGQGARDYISYDQVAKASESQGGAMRRRFCDRDEPRGVLDDRAHYAHVDCRGTPTT